MIIGIGIDIIELNRIEKMLDGKLKFMERILTENERNVAMELKRKSPYRVCSWKICSEKSIFKNCRYWYRERSELLDVEVKNDERGKPILITSTEYVVHLSISHSKEFAVAQVVFKLVTLVCIFYIFVSYI